MRIVLIADTFPPLRTSGAVQLRDLVRELAQQGHVVTVLLPSAEQQVPWVLENIEGAQVLRLKARRTKEVGYVRRTLAEFVMPFDMLRNLRKSPLANERWEGIVWYAPSIFHGPIVSALKKENSCRSYLIIRDIFPEWAVDMGLMGRGLPYQIFNAVAQYQYSVADVIGIQAIGNRRYFEHWRKQSGRRVEVLQNWLGKPGQARCSIQLHESSLVGRKVFVYAGNMGVAQGMNAILKLAERLRNRTDVGFLFVGRGSGAAILKENVKEMRLDNVLFFDEIHPDEIPALYVQCDIGIVALDHRHKSHNIPGKFLTYMQSGLPVLANVNVGNDLAALIRYEKVGMVCESNQVDELLALAEKLLLQLNVDAELSDRCRGLFERKFSSEKAVRQIVTALST